MNHQLWVKSLFIAIFGLACIGIKSANSQAVNSLGQADSLLHALEVHIDKGEFIRADSIADFFVDSKVFVLPDSMRLRFFRLNTRLHLNTNRLIEARASGEQTLSIAHAQNDTAFLLSSHADLASIYDQMGDGKMALRHHRSSLQYVGDCDTLAYYSILSNMSTSYMNLGILDSAIMNLTAAIEYFERVGDEYNQAILISNLGEFYRDSFEDAPKALRHYQRAIAIHKRIGLPKDLARNYHNYALAKLLLAERDSALHYIKLEMKLREELGDEAGMAMSYYSLGLWHMENEEYRQGLSYFENSLELSQDYGLSLGLIYSALGIARAHEKMNNYKVALKYYGQAADQAGEFVLVELELEALIAIYGINKDYGQWQEALSALEQIRNLEDSLHQASRSEALDEIKTRYETQLIEAENQQLFAENEMRAAKLQRKNWLLAGLGILLVLGLVVVLIISRILKQRNAAYKEATEARISLQEQLEVIKNHESKLANANEFKNRIITIMGHDLKAPLNSILSLLHLFEQDQLEDEIRTDLVGRLQKEVSYNLSSLRNLLEWSKRETDGNEPDKKILKAEAIIQECIDSLKSQIVAKNLSLEVNTMETVCADPNQFRSMVNNLLSNAVKYSPEEGTIRLSLLNQDKYDVLQVEDDGEGVSEEVATAIRGDVEVKSAVGTHGERGTGLGLRMVKDFAEAHNGYLDLKKRNGRGTIATIALPAAEKQKA